MELSGIGLYVWEEYLSPRFLSSPGAEAELLRTEISGRVFSRFFSW